MHLFAVYNYIPSLKLLFYPEDGGNMFRHNTGIVYNTTRRTLTKGSIMFTVTSVRVSYLTKEH
jgi:hypothetical protein